MQVIIAIIIGKPPSPKPGRPPLALPELVPPELVPPELVAPELVPPELEPLLPPESLPASLVDDDEPHAVSSATPQETMKQTFTLRMGTILLPRKPAAP
jgi:hypothetical protein